MFVFFNFNSKYVLTFELNPESPLYGTKHEHGALHAVLIKYFQKHCQIQHF